MLKKRRITDIKEKWGLFLVDNDLVKLEEQEDIEELNLNQTQKQSDNLKIKAEIIRKGEKKDNYRKIESNFDNFIHENFYSNKEYQYINPFNIISGMEEKSFEKAQNMCCNLSLGADYLMIYKKFIGIKNKIYLSDFQFIKNLFSDLKNKVETLQRQYNIYEQLIQKITFIGNNNFLSEQNKEKIKVCEDIIQNLNSNINFVNQTINNINSIKKDKIKANSISIKFSKIICKNEDIKKYFQDFGLFNTFILEPNEDPCNII